MKTQIMRCWTANTVLDMQYPENILGQAKAAHEMLGIDDQGSLVGLLYLCPAGQALPGGRE